MKNRGFNSAIAARLGLGIAIGLAMDNLGLWIAIGVAIGAGLGTTLFKKGSEKSNDGKPD